VSILISGVEKSFSGKLAIAKIDLELPSLGIVGLTGPSGCGKTTLLRILAGLAEPDSGQIQGIDFHQVSMVFQEDRLLPWLSALNNLAAVLPNEQLAQEWLDKMRLTEWGSHYPAELSGGMKRRIALARALAFPSELLLLDEPFTGLDAELKSIIQGYIRETAAFRLVLLVTHDEADLARMADQILSASGPPLTILNKQ
jgi:ABC-type nitrate/sulfonate/bicarbonate transport system ATPase subunit